MDQTATPVLSCMNSSRNQTATGVGCSRDIGTVWDELPKDVAWFVRQLHERGFKETHRETGPMDSGLIAFRRDPVEIRLVKDRSQWSVDLIDDGWGPEDRVSFPLFHGFARG